MTSFAHTKYLGWSNAHLPSGLTLAARALSTLIQDPASTLPFGKLLPVFEPNRGQTDVSANYTPPGTGRRCYLTPRAATPELTIPAYLAP